MKKLIPLVIDLATRQIMLRYRGSFFGLLWSVITPLAIISSYAFVFGVVFKSKWSAVASSRMDFALMLFIGLITFNIFSECMQRAPFLVLETPSYVKKVAFPLEVLPIVTLLVALFNASVSILIWLIFFSFFVGSPYVVVLFLPVLLLPLAMLSLGIGWLFSSISVYVRDLAQAVGFFTTILLFLSPVFYPLSAVPENYRWLIELNPIAYSVEQIRNLMFFGVLPFWGGVVFYTVACGLFAILCFWWFQRVRKGFADVM